MDTQTVARIRGSFELLAPRGHELVDTFYNNLFQTAPGVRPLFPADMKQQKAHLLAAIGLVVKHADNLASLTEPLLEMGVRHVQYGAQPEHYPVVRDTLLATLAQLAGQHWNDQLQADWTAALNAVAVVMLEGAKGAKKAA